MAISRGSSTLLRWVPKGSSTSDEHSTPAGEARARHQPLRVATAGGTTSQELVIGELRGFVSGPLFDYQMAPFFIVNIFAGQEKWLPFSLSNGSLFY